MIADMGALVATPGRVGASAAQVKAKLFRGLADSSRVAVLEALRDGPACVSDVVAATGQSQPSVSMHLACLWECGLVERERQGRFVQYRIADPRVVQLLDAGNALLLHVGDQVYVCTRYQEDDGASSDPVAARGRVAV